MEKIADRSTDGLRNFSDLQKERKEDGKEERKMDKEGERRKADVKILKFLFTDDRYSINLGCYKINEFHKKDAVYKF